MGADGESVDILVNVPAAGAYTLAWRYATGDSAVRVLSVNGATTNAAMASVISRVRPSSSPNW